MYTRGYAQDKSIHDSEQSISVLLQNNAVASLEPMGHIIPWKLHSHSLKGLRQRQISVSMQGRGVVGI